MGIVSYIKRKLSKDEPTYNVVVSKAPGTKVYDPKFIGPLERGGVRSSSSGEDVISNNPSYPRTKGFTTGGGSSGSSGSSSPTQTPTSTRAELSKPTPQKTIEIKKPAVDLSKMNELKKQEIYNQQTKTYISPTYPSGQGTGQIRRPNPTEQERIDLANYKGSYEGVKHIVTNRFNQGIEKVRELPIVVKAREKTSYWVEKNKDNDIFGLANKTGIAEDDLVSPKNVKKMFDWGAEQTLRAGEKLADTEIKYGLIKKDSWLTKPSPISGSTAKETISNMYMFSVFSPLMKTGSAQQTQSEYIYDYKTKRYVKKADVVDYLESPKVDINGKKVKVVGLTYTDKSNRIKELLSRATTPEQKQAILKTAEQTYGKTFVKDFISQESSFTSIKPASTIIEVELGNLPQMKNVGFVGSGTSTQDKFKTFSQTENLYKDQTKTTTQTNQNIFIKTTTDQQSKQKTIPMLNIKSSSATAQRPKTETKQDSLTKQIPKTATTLLSITKTAQRPQLKTDLVSSWLRTQPKSKKPIKPILPKLSLVKRLERKVEKEPEVFDIYGKRFGKDFLIGKASSKKKAKEKLGLFLTGTLGRSGKVLKDGEALSFEELGFGSQFRKGKKDSRRIIQKAKFSLGSGSERKEIQYFKKKKRKKKGGSLWLN